MRPRLEFESKFAVTATEACIQNTWDYMDWYFESGTSINSLVSTGYPSFSSVVPNTGSKERKRWELIGNIAMNITYSTTWMKPVGFWVPMRHIRGYETSTTSPKYAYGLTQWRKVKDESWANTQYASGNGGIPGYLLVLVQLPKSNITVVNSSNSEIMISPK